MGALISSLCWFLSSMLYCSAYDRDSHFYKSLLYQIDSIGLVKSFKKDPLVFVVLNLMPIFILPVSLIVLFSSLFVFPYKFITHKLSNIELKTSNNIAKDVMDEIKKNKK